LHMNTSVVSFLHAKDRAATAGHEEPSLPASTR